MAHLVFNRLLLDLIDPELRPAEESKLTIAARNVRELILQLDRQFPGVGRQLQYGVALAIDGEIFNDALLEPLSADCEVYFIPAIEGG